MRNSVSRVPGVYYFLIFIAAAAWIFSFRHFLTGKAGLLDDALPYYDHIKFYLDSMSRGVFPLWDPVRDFGTVNEFYLRRIGEFNPLFWIIVVLDKLGLSYTVAYRVFLGFYFFLGAAGFYFLARRLFLHPMTSFLALMLFSFSSLSILPFQTYLLLMLVPGIWFFYFLTAFWQIPNKMHLLGMTFCVMLLMITYIPFYFLTALLAAALAFVLAYAGAPMPWSGAGQFTRKFAASHKMFVLLCAVLTAVSLIPGLLWYQQSAKGEMLSPVRHLGSDSTNTAGLGIKVINEGGIATPMLVDQTFFDLDQRRPGDFYIPLFAFIVLAVGAFGGITRRAVFLFLWGMAVYLISVADAAPVHQFLYTHVFFFKYFRNMQFFLWLIMVPVFVLFVAEVFEAGLGLSQKNRKWPYLLYVGCVHAAGAWFFLKQDLNTIIPTTYLSMGMSFTFFTALAWRHVPVMRGILPVLLFLAVAVQPLEVYAHLSRDLKPAPRPSPYDGDYMVYNLPKHNSIAALIDESDYLRKVNAPYLSTWQFHGLFNNVNPVALRFYLKPRLLLYGQVSPLDENNLRFEQLEYYFTQFEDRALVAATEASAIQLNNHERLPHVKIVTADSKEIQVRRYNANELVLQTSLATDRFLVHNANYYSRWQVFVDGKKSRLYRANFSFQGVVVPAGEHTVAFRYDFKWHYAAAYVLAGMFAAVLGYLLWLTFKVRNF